MSICSLPVSTPFNKALQFTSGSFILIITTVAILWFTRLKREEISLKHKNDMLLLISTITALLSFIFRAETTCNNTTISNICSISFQISYVLQLSLTSHSLISVLYVVFKDTVLQTKSRYVLSVICLLGFISSTCANVVIGDNELGQYWVTLLTHLGYFALMISVICIVMYINTDRPHLYDSLDFLTRKAMLMFIIIAVVTMIYLVVQAMKMFAFVQRQSDLDDSLIESLNGLYDFANCAAQLMIIINIFTNVMSILLGYKMFADNVCCNKCLDLLNETQNNSTQCDTSTNV